jgi:hypothetical protein
VADLKRSLKEAVKRLAYSTSVDQLKKRGVKRVSVLGLDRIVSLIEEAVHRSLRHRLLSTEREAVVDATKEEFLRLLKSNEELREKQERSEEEANNLRIELQRLRQQLDERLDEARAERLVTYEGENAAILEKVRAVVAGFDPTSMTAEGVQERVLELVMDVVSGERREVEAAQAAARDREIDLLQRRIRKLTDSLETTETRLSQVAAMKDVEEGIASVYRDVQGLQGDGEDTAKKKELMAGIFAANMQLQKKS